MVNRLAKLIEEMSIEDAYKLRMDLKTGNIERLIEKKLRDG